MQYILTETNGISIFVTFDNNCAKLCALDDRMQLTSKSVTLKKTKASVLMTLCDAFERQHKITSEEVENAILAAHSTVSMCRDRINEACIELGFTRRCISAFQLDEGFSCRLAVSAPADSVLSDILEQEILFDDAGAVPGPVSTLGQKKYKYLPQANTQYHCLLLYGKGGLGKTTFLKQLMQGWRLHLGEVHYCALSVLLEEARTAPIMNRKHCGADITAAGCFGTSYSSYLFRHCGILRCDPTQTYTFLLDGLNELNDRNNSQNYDCVRQIFDEIAMLNVENVYVVLTTRSRTDQALLPHLGSIRTATLSGVHEDVPQIAVGSPEAVNALFRLPLFYQMYRRLHRQRKAIPDTRYAIWSMFHRNACEQDYTQKNMPADEMLYIYYIFLPMFAHFMESNRIDHITKTQAIRLIDKVQNSTAMQEICRNIINQIEEGRVRSQIWFLKTSQILYQSFRNIDYFITCSDDRITFLHQDIREYFAAFHVVWYLKSIRSAPLMTAFIPNFNLKSDVQKMVLDALGFISIKPSGKHLANPDVQTLRQKNGETLLALFGTSEPILASTDMEEIHAQIYQNLCLTFAAYSFTDHFMLHLPGTRYQITAPFCESLIRSKRFLSDYRYMLPLEERQMMIEVYAALIFYHRLQHNYSKCREIYEFCMEYLAADCAPYYIVKLRHQRGKALLYNSQDLLTGIQAVSQYYSEGEKCAEEIFSEAIEELESCLPYNMTANILGHLYSMPVKWITDHGLLKRDVCKAFSVYLQAYQEMTDPDYLLVRLGTELIYTARQMLGLLVKGHVCLRNQNPEPGSGCPLFVGEMSRETMEFAEEVLTHLTGQRYPFLDWIRGVVNLYFGHSEAAKQNFENEPDNAMTKIVALRLQQTDDEEVLREEIRDALLEAHKTAGQTVTCEHTDTMYYLMDAEMLGYTL